MSYRTVQFGMQLAVSCLLVSGGQAAERITSGNLVSEGIPAIPTQLSERVQQYQNTRSAVFTVLSSPWVSDSS